MGNEEETKDTIVILKKIRSNAKGKFTRKVKVLEEFVDKDDPSEVLNSIRDEVCECFTDLEKCNEGIIGKLDNPAAIDECQEYMLVVEREKCRIMAHCALKQRTAVNNNCSQSKSLVVKKNWNLRDSVVMSGNIPRLIKILRDLWYPNTVKTRMSFGNLCLARHCI